VASNRLKTLYQFVDWALRESHAIQNRKDSVYIQKVLNCLSFENLFWASDLEDHGSATEDLRHIVDRHLNSVSKTNLGFKYRSLTTIETMMGKRNPIMDEEKRRIIIRIKKYMGELINGTGHDRVNSQIL